MRSDRRGFMGAVGTGAIGGRRAPTRAVDGRAVVRRPPTYDVAVIGAGVFGAWTAWHLGRSGRRVALVDAYGPGNSRASSGGESRVIRMGYGDRELYTHLSRRSLGFWKKLERDSERSLFLSTGVLWMAQRDDPVPLATVATLRKLGVAHERLSRSELEARWPQIEFGPITWAIYEPQSGVLLARTAVRAVVQQAVDSGVDYIQGRVEAPAASSALASIKLGNNARVSADTFVFACGPWLPQLFPDLLGERIVPTRQEVFYFGPPAGNVRFAPPALPVWVDFAEQIYGLPDVEEFVTRRFPGLKDAPLVASEVCPYENTSNGDFWIDRHPGRENVWLVGGGSGHGFKHGPAVGEYVAARLVDGQPVETAFSLGTKEKVRHRVVFHR